MKKLAAGVFVIAVIVVLAILLRSGGGSPSGQISSSPEKLGDLGRPPELTLKDYSGKEVALADFGGKVAVLNSWAVWCPFCRDELRDFGRLQEEFGDRVVVVAIDRAESLEKAKGFTDSIGVTEKMLFLLDSDDSFYRNIGGFSMPETIFVDPTGAIRIHKRGPMAFEEMREKVLSVMAAQNQ